MIGSQKFCQKVEGLVSFYVSKHGQKRAAAFLVMTKSFSLCLCLCASLRLSACLSLPTGLLPHLLSVYLLSCPPPSLPARLCLSACLAVSLFVSLSSFCLVVSLHLCLHLCPAVSLSKCFCCSVSVCLCCFLLLVALYVLD